MIDGALTNANISVSLLVLFVLFYMLSHKDLKFSKTKA